MRFERLFRSEADAVRSYALRRADPADADDVVAETFLVAWRRFDDMPSDPRPWLLSVARRVLANRRRSVQRLASLSADWRRRAGRSSRLGRRNGATDLRLAVLAALERLPDKEREAIGCSRGIGCPDGRRDGARLHAGDAGRPGSPRATETRRRCWNRTR